MSRHHAPPAQGGNVLAFARPRRARACEPSEHARLATEASLRASEVYVRLLCDRLETARRARAGGGLGRLEASALDRVIATADTLQRVCAEALAQVDRQLAARADLVAQAAADLVPGSSR